MIYITVKLSCTGFFTRVSLQVLALAGQPKMEEINGQLKKYIPSIYIYITQKTSILRAYITRLTKHGCSH